MNRFNLQVRYWTTIPTNLVAESKHTAGLLFIIPSSSLVLHEDL